MLCVLDDDRANELHAMQTYSSLELSHIGGSREVIQLEVLAPENITKKCKMTVEVIDLPQVITKLDDYINEMEPAPQNLISCENIESLL